MHMQKLEYSLSKAAVVAPSNNNNNKSLCEHTYMFLMQCIIGMLKINLRKYNF